MGYLPTLKARPVELARLVLDPNNPRFQEHTEERVADADLAELDVAFTTREKMKEEHYRVNELKSSILNNGWHPVDMIFVRRLPRNNYLVLEGNRRVAALKDIKATERSAATRSVLKDTDPLEVMEVLGKGSDEELKTQISYLLGVRHHGSLKQWSPFAQAHNMFERYLRVAEQSEDDFSWNDEVATTVAETLSLPTKMVRERLGVYRAMAQIDRLPNVKAAGGIVGRYYSLCREVLDRAKKHPLNDYIRQDPVTFLLDDESLKRMDNLCHFSTQGRAHAPIKNPAEWRSLEKILEDEDEARRDEMRRRVEDGQEHPSDVYAERAAELRKPRWDQWLGQVAQQLNKVELGQVDDEDADAREVVQRLDQLLVELNAMAVPSEEG